MKIVGRLSWCRPLGSLSPCRIVATSPQEMQSRKCPLGLLNMDVQFSALDRTVTSGCCACPLSTLQSSRMHIANLQKGDTPTVPRFWPPPSFTLMCELVPRPPRTANHFS